MNIKEALQKLAAFKQRLFGFQSSSENPSPTPSEESVTSQLSIHSHPSPLPTEIRRFDLAVVHTTLSTHRPLWLQDSVSSSQIIPIQSLTRKEAIAYVTGRYHGYTILEDASNKDTTSRILGFSAIKG
mgnify:CR=1 FL=1